jgi:hypothetical protein
MLRGTQLRCMAALALNSFVDLNLGGMGAVFYQMKRTYVVY